MESVSFDTLTFDHPTACRPARVSASLHLPADRPGPVPCMVILTSSAGVQRHREHYYADLLNAAGAAALIVDSFTRPWRPPHRGRPDPGVGGPDGGRRLRGPRPAARRPPHRSAVASASWASPRAAWRRSTPPSPCASAGDAAFLTCSTSTSPSVPGRRPSIATPPHTVGRCSSCWRPSDDYTPAELAIEYAERMRGAGNDRIKVKVYGGAHHGWELLGPVFDIKDAENWSCCRNIIEDDGRISCPRCRAGDETSPITRHGRDSTASPAAPAPAAGRPN